MKKRSTSMLLALTASVSMIGGTAFITTAAQAAPMPSLVAADTASPLTVKTISSSQLQIAWTAPTNPTKGWEVGRDGTDTTGYGAWHGTIAGSARNQTFNDLRSGVVYNFYVKNLDTGAVTKVAAKVGDNSAVTPAPSQGSLSVKTVSNSQLQVAWTSSTNPTKGWEVGRDGTDTTGYGAWHGTVAGSARNQTFNDLRSNTVYNFYVKNLDTGAVMKIAAKVGNNTTTPAPTTPTSPLTTKIVSNNQIQVSWASTSSPAKGWEVGRDGTDTTGYGAWHGTLAGSARSNTFNNLRSGATYNFYVKNLDTGAVMRVAAKMSGTTTTPTNPAPSSGWKVGQRSGLPFDLGVFAHDPERVKRFESTVGRKVDVYQVAPQRNEGFDVMLSETKRIMGYIPAGAKVDLAVPLLSYDQARQLGQVLQSTGHGDAYVRPGWEFNLGGMGWKWTVDQIGYDAYIKGFRDNVNGFRSAAPGVKMEWNPNAHTKGFNHAVKAYPGDAYVDVIGVDVYNWSYEDSWTGDGGLNQWLDFAKQHGKKMTLPEWGVHGGSDGMGDNPAYITKMLNWVKANRDTVVMASYFDENMSYIKNSIADGQMPKSATAFRQALSNM